ncbi:phage tail tape measure protein [Staphylococcus aureus]|nr:phage tail tape measure protein [Staphylococcus aureus]
MKVAYDDATLAAHQYITEAAEVDTERQLQLNANRLRDAQNELSKADYKAGFISQEYQIDLYRKNQEAKFKGYLKEKEALEQNKSELQDMYEIYKSVPTQAQKIKEALIETKNAIRDNNKGLYDLKYDMANSVINQIKDIYSKQLEVATKAYDDEYKAYEKMINKKLKLIDDEQTQESFNKDVRDRTEAMDKIRDEIAQRSGDDSLANQKKLKDLREQLKQQEEDYTMFINNKNRDDRRKALQDELNDKNEQIQEQKEDLNKAFQDLIGDTRRFNAIQESLMEGQIDKYKSLIADLTKYVNDNMKEIGRSTSEGILDGLAASFKGLSSLSKELQKQEKNNLNPVPNSKLKPTKVDEATIAAIKKVNGLSPTTILQGLDIKPVNLPKDVKPSKTVTNNNKTTAKALVNIENFNGTKAEADKLANNLATAMRKQGVL